jgi:hypothetical protein
LGTLSGTRFEMAMLRTCMMTTLIAAALGSALVPAPAADCAYRGCSPPPPAVWVPLPYNGVPVSFGYGLCYQRELLQTPGGPRWRLVNHCP